MQTLDSMAPISRYVPVTKADANLPDGIARSLWIGTEGTLNLMQADGTVRTNVRVFPGLLPFYVLQVRTGGTADNIWALY